MNCVSCLIPSSNTTTRSLQRVGQTRTGWAVKGASGGVFQIQNHSFSMWSRWSSNRRGPPVRLPALVTIDLALHENGADLGRFARLTGQPAWCYKCGTCSRARWWDTVGLSGISMVRATAVSLRYQVLFASGTIDCWGRFLFFCR